LAKRTKRGQRGAPKGKTKRTLRRPPKVSREDRRRDAEETQEDEKFTYQKTFTQKNEID